MNSYVRRLRNFFTTPEEPVQSDANKVMESGRCREILALGTMQYPCPCDAGIFNVPLNQTVDTAAIQCTRCTHLISSHAHASSRRDTHSGDASATPEDTSKVFLGPTYTLRQKTVARLWARIKQEQVVHVRGTPASGKSTLAFLLAQYVMEREENMRVHRVTWSDQIEDYGHQTSYNILLNSLTGRPRHLDDWLSERRLIIIDEAQTSYKFKFLWNDLVKFVGPGFSVYVVLFSSYGSPSRQPLEVKTETPLFFKPRQRIGIKRTDPSDLGIFFTREEYDEVVSLVRSSYGDHQQFKLSSELIDFIYHITAGHPAGVHAVLIDLAESSAFRKYRKDSREISLEDSLEYMNSENFLLQVVRNAKFGRGLPQADYLQSHNDVVQFLRHAVTVPHIPGPFIKESPLDHCYRNGWLQAELSWENDDELTKSVSTLYVFSSILHNRCIQHLLPRPDHPFPVHAFTGVTHFSFSVLRRFSCAALSKSNDMGPGAMAKPLEYMYQDEFYKACYVLLGNLYLTPEWSGSVGSGRIDYHVRGAGWVIECMRDGIKLDEHVARFLPGGRYYEWIESGEIQDYILLDFRTSYPRKRRGDVPWLFHIIFANDYPHYTIYNSRGEIVVGEKDVALLE